MLYNFRILLSSGLVALLLLCFANIAHGYGMECEKPTIIATTGIASPFTFNCTNSTTSAHFASYEVFPVCTDDSTPAGICDSTTFAATGCSHTLAPGAVCEVQGSFMPEKTGIYTLDFNDKYGSVTYYDIFCNDPKKGCITADASAFAYVTGTVNGNIIDKCPLNTTGDNAGEFSSCTTAYDGSSDLQSYTTLTFAVVDGQQYAYITNQSGSVYKCFIQANGDFESCAPTTPTLDPTGWNPRAITFATVGGTQYAYITDLNSDSIYQCSLDPTQGLLTSCLANTDISFSAPYGIDFATVGGTQYAYIADAGDGIAGDYGQISQCTLNVDSDPDINGTIKQCTPISMPPLQPTPPPVPPLPPINAIPYAIDFAVVDGVQYAYVADNGTGSNNGNIYQCTLNINSDVDINGTFGECIAQNAPSSGWTPYDIAFATLNGTQYAYVTSNSASTGSAYWCTLNGSFDCNPTPASPPTPWAPASIAFRFD